MQRLVLIALAFPALVGAELLTIKRDGLAAANSSCAAFYVLVQTIVSPEARPGYKRKYETHLRYAKGLHESSESQPVRLQSAIKLQADALNEAKSDDAKRAWLRDGMLGCNSVESTTPLIAKEHQLIMDAK